jgi:hypothetical protein
MMDFPPKSNMSNFQNISRKIARQGIKLNRKGYTGIEVSPPGDKHFYKIFTQPPADSGLFPDGKTEHSPIPSFY